MIAATLLALLLSQLPPPPPPPNGGRMGAPPPPPAQHSRTESVFDCPKLRVTVIREEQAVPVYRENLPPSERSRNVLRIEYRRSIALLADGSPVNVADAIRLQAFADGFGPIQSVSVFCGADRSFTVSLSGYPSKATPVELEFDGGVLVSATPREP